VTRGAVARPGLRHSTWKDEPWAEFAERAYEGQDPAADAEVVRLGWYLILCGLAASVLGTVLLLW
jgi:hypothetical protein